MRPEHCLQPEVAPLHFSSNIYRNSKAFFDCEQLHWMHDTTFNIPMELNMSAGRVACEIACIDALYIFTRARIACRRMMAFRYWISNTRTQKIIASHMDNRGILRPTHQCPSVCIIAIAKHPNFVRDALFHAHNNCGLTDWYCFGILAYLGCLC